MKKRSLVAAIAMLVVSAIVLTSATYAWFASNTSASISAFTADVGNTAGSVYISATGNDNTWKSTLTASEMSGISTDLKPVSYDPAADEGAGHFYNGGFVDVAPGTSTSTGKFIYFQGASTATNSFYTATTVYIYTETAGTVTVTPTLAGDKDNVPYVYASAKSADDQIILGATNDSYYPINVTANTTATATDNNPQNGIIDADEATAGTNISLGSQVKVTNATTLTLHMQPGTTNKQAVTFYVWAEGQDASCVGTATGAPEFSVGFSFQPAASSSATNNG